LNIHIKYNEIKNKGVNNMKKTVSKIIAFLISLCILSTSISAMAFDMSYGVDVSEWNTTVNYDKVKSDGNKFVMIRLGYGTAHLDKYFWQNIKAACDAGLDYGIYFYSYAYNEYDAQQEADFVIETLSQLGTYAKNFKLPIAFDLEEPEIAKRCNKTQITRIMTTFLDTIEAADYVPMIYANQNWFLNYIDLNTVVSKKYKIWYAYYNGKPSSSSQIQIGTTGVKPDMWQYYGVQSASPTVFDKNVIYYTSDIVKPLNCNHEYSLTLEKATPTADGKKIRTCSKCSNTFTSLVIPKVSTIELQKTTIGYNWYYTGKQITPYITVKDSTGTALKRGTDYSLTYDSGRVNIGKYSIKVTLKGNYSGTKTFTFEIVEKPVNKWIKSGNRWWYRHADGSYTKNGWEKISGKWYHFDKSGWMQTGWLKDGGKWYYLNSSGAMATGWVKVSNKWYYMNSSGAMTTGWQKVSNKWYYMNSSGAMQTGWIKLSGKWYYLNSSGAMLTGRQKIGNKWYTFNSSGVWIK